MPASELDHRLVIGVASSALSDLAESGADVDEHGEAPYRVHQHDHIDDTLAPGPVFPFEQRLLRSTTCGLLLRRSSSTERMRREDRGSRIRSAELGTDRRGARTVRQRPPSGHPVGTNRTVPTPPATPGLARAVRRANRRPQPSQRMTSADRPARTTARTQIAATSRWRRRDEVCIGPTRSEQVRGAFGRTPASRPISMPSCKPSEPDSSRRQPSDSSSGSHRAPSTAAARN
ncbi:MAG TPA: 5'-nucleotidase [Nocardioides sp.]